MKRYEIANIVDDSWHYSWHWKDYGWQEQALSDCKDRLTAIKKELTDLEKAHEYLEKFVNDELINNE